MQKITLNIVPNGICPRVYVNQYDLGRQFQISFNEGAQVYNFPNGATFKINGRKADNHVYEYTEADTWDGTNPVISKSGSGTSLVVTIATTEQMTAAPGEAKVQLTYKISNAVTGTLNFIMVIQERPESSGDPSESDVPDVVRSVNGVTPDADGDVVVPGSGTAVTKNFASLEASRTMTATRNIGNFVYISSEDQLYEITATISSGGTLIPNTNATAVTVGDVLQMLNSELTYNTTETPCGTWIDGKTIYRKVVPFTVPAANVDTPVALATGIDRLIKLDIAVKASTWQLTESWAYPVVEPNNYGIKGYLTSYGNVAITNYYSVYEGASGYIIAEYTKT